MPLVRYAARFLLVILTVCVSSLTASELSVFWNPAGASTDGNDSANWTLLADGTGGSPGPLSNLHVLSFAGTGVSSTQACTFTANLSVKRIEVPVGTTAISDGGNTLSLGGLDAAGGSWTLTGTMQFVQFVAYSGPVKFPAGQTLNNVGSTAADVVITSDLAIAGTLNIFGGTWDASTLSNEPIITLTGAGKVHHFHPATCILSDSFSSAGGFVIQGIGCSLSLPDGANAARTSDKDNVPSLRIEQDATLKREYDVRSAFSFGTSRLEIASGKTLTIDNGVELAINDGTTVSAAGGTITTPGTGWLVWARSQNLPASATLSLNSNIVLRGPIGVSGSPDYTLGAATLFGGTFPKSLAIEGGAEGTVAATIAGAVTVTDDLRFITNTPSGGVSVTLQSANLTIGGSCYHIDDTAGYGILAFITDGGPDGIFDIGGDLDFSSGQGDESVVDPSVTTHCLDLRLSGSTCHLGNLHSQNSRPLRIELKATGGSVALSGTTTDYQTADLVCGGADVAITPNVLILDKLRIASGSPTISSSTTLGIEGIQVDAAASTPFISADLSKGMGSLLVKIDGTSLTTTGTITYGKQLALRRPVLGRGSPKVTSR